MRGGYAAPHTKGVYKRSNEKENNFMDTKKLTAKQKVRLVMGADFWTNYDVDGAIYKFVVSDGPIGLRQPVDRNTAEQHDCIKSVAYPSFQMLSQTWDEELAYKLGYSLGNDCIEQKVDILLAPGVNIKRLPTCGRNFEYLSEDPYIAGILAREYIKGVQEKHVGTALKHFCCNNSEKSRHWVSSEVDERTMREIYLRPFEIALEAKPWTVMSSYNLVNGVRMSEHEKLYRVLRDEFGFDGLIMSDWDAVKDSEASLNAGLNLEMPYNEEHQRAMLEKAEKLDPEKLDEGARRVIALAEKCGKESKLRKADMTLEERRAVALKIEEEGIALLKNDGALPLKNGKTVVTGAAAWRYYYGGGSSNVFPEREFESLETALKNEGANAVYVESVWDVEGHQANLGNLKNAVRAAAEADYTVLCVGEPNTCEYESVDRLHIKLSKEEELAVHSLAQACDKLIVVVYAGAAVDMSGWIDEVDAVVWAGYGGEFVNKAVAEVLTGKVNPCGKLTETFPLSLEDVPAENAYADEAVMLYSEGLNVGYRYFDTYGVPVLFPFGYGLSYSEFNYANLTVKKSGDNVKVSFDIENISDTDGKEIAQIYVREITKEVYRPYKELKAFKKAFVKAHGKTRVELTLGRDAFAYYSVARDKWTVHGGVYEICVGASVEDIRLSTKIVLE